MTDWQSAVDEIREREALGRRMGGPEKVARQHANGKLDVRQRIDALLDAGSFRELGTLSGKARYEHGGLREFLPTNFLTGRGRIDGRMVVVGADDFTVRGGASDAFNIRKQIYSEQMANELRVPIVRLVDGTGGGGSIRSLVEMGRTYVPALPGWEVSADNLATVPVVSLALGPCAGFGAARVVASHYSVMVRGISQIFTAGPPLVAAIGETVTKDELGGVDVHGRNGTVDAVVDSEAEAFECTRRFLSYLPSSVHDLPPRAEPTDDPDRRDDWLVRAIPVERRRVYKIRPIIESIVDTGSFFELGARFGRALVTGLARLDGWPVAVMANDPYIYGGSWGADAADKAVRFVDLADTFHLPVVHLVDNPGFLIGTEAEKSSAIRHGMRALSAVYQARVPWCSIILRKVFGVGGAGHSNAARLQYRYAWPSADWGSIPAEGGVEAAYRAELEASDDPAALMADIMARIADVQGVIKTAEAFDIEQLIDPRDTRPLLCEFADLVAPLRTPGRVAWGLRP
ncbi:MAG: acyl-CoA carboxylase subunit beta [Jatrophihabitans sp.]|uniref:acyl-CoA carboxylase subunit beta n=1 Tax=Jatrophihabitans sp. TaxID=1932789 RepID=UPI003F7D2F0D